MTLTNYFRAPLLRALLVVAAAVGAPPLLAQDRDARFPTDTIRLIVPYPAGGTFDIIGRLFADALATRLGKPAIVDNRPGAASMVGAGVVAQAKPDGHTLLILPNSTMTMIPHLYSKMPYKPDALEAVGLLATAQFVVAANAKFEPDNIQELVALARRQPGKVSFGSFGKGTGSHLSGELLNQMAGTDMLHVPYRGSAPGLTDLMGNNISVMFDAIPAVAPHIRAGTLKALAVTGPARSALLPDVPTVAESGFPGYRTDGWLGLAGPAGMPAHVRQTLARAVADIANDPAFQQRLRDRGMEPVSGGQPDMQKFLAEETARYKAVVEKANIRMD